MGSVDDPDQKLFENYICGAERNYTGYCNRELEQEFERKSSETDQDKRKHMVWQIDHKLQEEVVQPIISHTRLGTCWQPWAHGPETRSTTAGAWKTPGSTNNRDCGWPLRTRAERFDANPMSDRYRRG